MSKNDGVIVIQAEVQLKSIILYSPVVLSVTFELIQLFHAMFILLLN